MGDLEGEVLIWKQFAEQAGLFQRNKLDVRDELEGSVEVGRHKEGTQQRLHRICDILTGTGYRLDVLGLRGEGRSPTLGIRACRSDILSKPQFLPHFEEKQIRHK